MVDDGGSARGAVQSVERALDVLACLAESGDLGPTEIGAQLALHKSTVHRLLRALASRGFVIQDNRTERYSIGPAALRIAQRLIVSPDLAQTAQAMLEELRQATGETSVLDVRLGDERICIAQAESDHEIRRAQRLAFPMPLYAGACGRVLLMDESPHSLHALIERMPFNPLTSRTPTSVQALQRHVNQLRRSGFTISMGERVAGATTVAVPVRNSAGALVAALAVTGPSFRFDTKRARGSVPMLLEASAALAGRLGSRATAWSTHT